MRGDVIGSVVGLRERRVQRIESAAAQPDARGDVICSIGAQLDASVAQLDATAAQLDATVAQLDASVAQLDGGSDDIGGAVGSTDG
jgi:hypothetical protein